MDAAELKLREEGAEFVTHYLNDAIDAASADGVNPAVALYGLLECAMRLSEAHFAEHANQLFASATQMVFEAHQNPVSKQ